MEFTEKELEALITYAEQIKVLVPQITYSEELIKDLFKSMKDKTEVIKENLEHIGNNFLVLSLIGFDYDRKLENKVFKYLEW